MCKIAETKGAGFVVGTFTMFFEKSFNLFLQLSYLEISGKIQRVWDDVVNPSAKGHFNGRFKTFHYTFDSLPEEKRSLKIMCLCNYFSHHVNFFNYLLRTFVKDGWFAVKVIDDNFQYFLSHISDDIFCLVLKSKKSLKKIRLSGQNDFVNWMGWTIVLRKTKYEQFCKLTEFKIICNYQN